MIYEIARYFPSDQLKAALEKWQPNPDSMGWLDKQKRCPLGLLLQEIYGEATNTPTSERVVVTLLKNQVITVSQEDEVNRQARKFISDWDADEIPDLKTALLEPEP
jgi:hypothetical protein